MTSSGDPSSARGPRPAFELRGLRRVFGEGPSARTALDGVSFTLSAGAFAAISGPSGSGKSTLLTILGALDRGYEGEARIFGQDLARLGERKLGELRSERLGFLFQSFHLLPHLSVLENVLAPWLFARAGGDGEASGRRALDRVGLLSRAADRPQHLSGGQRQRVALARALVRSPTALLCDEPTGNLDRRTGDEIIELLSSLHRDDKRTVIVVTHEPRLAARAEERIELVDGRVASAPEAGA